MYPDNKTKQQIRCIQSIVSSETGKLFLGGPTINLLNSPVADIDLSCFQDTKQQIHCTESIAASEIGKFNIFLSQTASFHGRDRLVPFAGGT